MTRRLSAVAVLGIVASILVFAMPSGGPTRAAGGYLVSARMTSGVARIATVDATFVDGFVLPGGSLLDVASDATHLYWLDTTGARIGRAALDGTAVEPAFLSIGADGSGLAVDAAHVYWIHNAAGVWAIGRADIDGTNVVSRFIVGTGAGSGAMTNAGVAVDADHIYWTNFASGTGTSIGRANLDGTGVEPAWLTGLVAPCRIAVSGGYLYWSSWATLGSIGRAATDGTGATTLVGAISRPWGLAVDGTHVYWSVGNTGSIGRAALDGTDATSAWANGLLGWGRGLAVAGSAGPAPTPSPTPTASPTPTPSPTPSPTPTSVAATPSPSPTATAVAATPTPGLAPVVTSFSPRAGAPGRLVTILGTGLGYVRTVTFNGTLASFSVRSPTTIVATVPAGASTGPISVVSPFGSATSAGSFIVLP
jgi:hypothetical protein